MRKIFPDNRTDFYLEVNDVSISTNFSNMGEADGIEISCVAVFKRNKETILMNPTWNGNEVDEKLKESFPFGYFVFLDSIVEKMHFHFRLNYDKITDTFIKIHTKKNDVEGRYYTNYITKNYTEAAISEFEDQLVQNLLKKYVKKISYK